MAISIESRIEDVSEVLNRMSAYDLGNDEQCTDFFDYAMAKLYESHPMLTTISLYHMAKYNLGDDMSAMADFLEFIGHYTSPLFEDARRITCEHMSRSASSWLRDAALRGVSYLNNSKSLVSLRIALKYEDNERLQNYIVQLIDRFQSRQPDIEIDK